MTVSAGLVEFLDHVAQEIAVTVLVGAVESLDQHFDGAPDLFTERVGNVVLILQGPLEQRRLGALIGPEEATNAQKADEGAKRSGSWPQRRAYQLANPATAPTGAWTNIQRSPLVTRPVGHPVARSRATIR